MTLYWDNSVVMFTLVLLQIWNLFDFRKLFWKVSCNYLNKNPTHKCERPKFSESNGSNEIYERSVHTRSYSGWTCPKLLKAGLNITISYYFDHNRQQIFLINSKIFYNWIQYFLTKFEITNNWRACFRLFQPWFQ